VSTITLDTALPSSAVRPGERMRRIARRRRYLINAGAAVLTAVLVVWTLLPLYNIVMVSLQPHGDVFTDQIYPHNPTLEGFWVVITQGYWYLEYFWHQFGNSLYVGAAVTILTLLIGSLASFSIVLGDPVLSDHAELRAGEQPVVGHRRHGDLCHSVLDLYLLAIRQGHSA